MIRRGTTPTHVFNTSLDLTGATKLYITYSQRGANLIEKELDDCTVASDSVTTVLTQEESLKLDPKSEVEIQIRALLSGDVAVASNIIKTEAGKILKGGVI